MCLDRKRLEVAIIGGGLAGSVFAARLAAAGVSVTLIERDRFPRDKLCGEFLSPESAHVLDQVGALEPVLALDPPRMAQAVFSSARGRSATFDLPGTGLGVSRLRLDRLLFERARSLGACILHGEVRRIEPKPGGNDGWQVEVHSESGLRKLGFDRVVGAFGRHSRLDGALGRASSGRDQWVGIKRHHCPVKSMEGLPGRVEIHLFSGGYCGVNFVEEDRVNVCALVRSSWLRRRKAAGRSWFNIMAEENPALAHRLRSMQPLPSSRTLTVSGIDFRRLEPVRQGLPLLGDASAMIAPLAGDGQAMALTSAWMLAEAVLSEGWDQALHRWRSEYVRRFRARLTLGRLLQAALLHPVGAEALVRSVRAWPGLGAMLARQTRDPVGPITTPEIEPDPRPEAISTGR